VVINGAGARDIACKERRQPELFVTGSLRQLIPDDHLLARVDRVLDLSWLRAEVAAVYCADNGRPGIRGHQLHATQIVSLLVV
jgi:hypothetical protein